MVLPVYDPTRFPLTGTDIPTQILNKVGQEAKKLVCHYVTKVTPRIFDPTGMANAQGEILKYLLCPDAVTEPPPGASVPPYTGGQCNNVLYVATIRLHRADGTFSDVAGNLGGYGPMVDAYLVETSTNTKFPFGPNPFFGNQQARVQSWTRSRQFPGAPIADRQSGLGAFATSITRFEKLPWTTPNGETDSCGDPPGVVVPPRDPTPAPLPQPWNFTLPITFPSGNTFNFPVFFNSFQPRLDLGPFNFDLNLNGTFPIHIDLGGVHFGGGGSGGDGAPPAPPVSIPCIEELCEMASDYLTERQIGLLASSCDSEGEPVAFPAQGRGFALLKQVFEQLNEAAQYRQSALCEATKGAAPPSLEWVSLGDKVLSGVLNFPADELFYGVRTVAKVVPPDLRTRYSAIRKRQIGSIAYGQGGFLREEHYVHWDGWLLQPLPLSGDILSYSFQPGCVVEIQVLREVQEQG